MKIKINDKGFTLVEIIVCVAILGVLSAVLIPSLRGMGENSKEKADNAAIINLEGLVSSALQENSTYKESRKLAETFGNGEMIIDYDVDDDKQLFLNKITIGINDDMVSADTDGEVGEKIQKIETKIQNYTNANSDPIVFGSKQYQYSDYKIKVTFPDVEFKVNTELIKTKETK